MTSFRDLPLRRKLLLMTLVTSGAALVLAIASSAYASEHDRNAATAAGYQAHVAKPFDPREVAVLIAQLTHTSEARPM